MLAVGDHGAVPGEFTQPSCSASQMKLLYADPEMLEDKHNAPGRL